MNNFGEDKQTAVISKKRGRPKQTNSDGEEMEGFSDDE